ncbi:hypothetical protein [Halobacillus litoralis]|uniref:Uncharacterized protein n=1 Tax=Halobacillus litoralis TaxID=45668 RepID=A0A410MJD9_9BACI|nr:hypothetical protein [Halobacillus litoralis]QAS54775.1 hypothetical protein HLI_21190 [Halobacillus litoralis]
MVWPFSFKRFAFYISCISLAAVTLWIYSKTNEIGLNSTLMIVIPLLWLTGGYFYIFKGLGVVSYLERHEGAILQKELREHLTSSQDTYEQYFSEPIEQDNESPEFTEVKEHNEKMEEAVDTWYKTPKSSRDNYQRYQEIKHKLSRTQFWLTWLLSILMFYTTYVFLLENPIQGLFLYFAFLIFLVIPVLIYHLYLFRKQEVYASITRPKAIDKFMNTMRIK